MKRRTEGKNTFLFLTNILRLVSCWLSHSAEWISLEDALTKWSPQPESGTEVFKTRGSHRLCVRLQNSQSTSVADFHMRDPVTDFSGVYVCVFACLCTGVVLVSKQKCIY